MALKISLEYPVNRIDRQVVFGKPNTPNSVGARLARDGVLTE
jgi:hypothetical protein